MSNNRLFVKITRETLPYVKDKYPFIYLERGRVEVDDSSIKWIDSDGNVVRIPCALLNTVLLGTGTAITHEAIKTMASANCMVCWVGEDGLRFYAMGQSPTATTVNIREQAKLSSIPAKSIIVARRMFSKRFNNSDLSNVSLAELKGMEGKRVRVLYEELAEKHQVGWSGRQYKPGKMELSDLTNQLITSFNHYLYSILLAAVHSIGYSPYLGFIHSGSPLPFVYDISDLYKDKLCIEPAFILTKGFPHAYGGVSTYSKKGGPMKRVSPCIWGCFSARNEGFSWNKGFPMHMGVFPCVFMRVSKRTWFPHAYGGVSL